MRYRLIIFDWDGTLADSIGNIVACTQEAASSLGYPEIPERKIRAVIGLSLRESIRTFLPGCSDDEFERLVVAYRDCWIANYRNRAKLFRGAVEALDELKSRGHMLAVATGKSRAGLDREIVATGLEGRFLATRTPDEAASKPSPEMVLGLLDETGTRAAEAVVIGDTVHDLDMARNAGVDAVAVLGGSHERRHLEASEPIGLLSTVAELPVWLARL